MRILSNLNVSGFLDIDTINNAAADTDKFLVADANGVVKFRTGAEVASDIGASVGYVSTVKHEVKLGEAIAKGQAVYVTSSDGTNMIVSKASNATDVTSSKTLGLIETGGNTNAKVFVITEGLLAGLDTSTATAGAPVWLGTDGNLLYGLAAKPLSPAHMVFIGIVTRVNANNGEIFVNVQNGFELEELHDVLITGTPVDKAIIQYDLASGLWKNSALAGITGAGAGGQVAYWSGTNTQTGSNNLFWDATNSRLGIGTNTPAYITHIVNNGNNEVAIQSILNGTSASLRLISPVNYWQISNGGASGFLTFNRGGTNLAQFTNTGNFMLQNGGTFTDSGQRLQVTGDTLLKGSGNTSGTNALVVQNSDGTGILNVRNDRYAIYGTSALPSGIYLGSSLKIYQTNNTTTENQANQDGYFIGSTGSTNSTYSKLWLGFTPTTGFNSTSGNPKIVTIQGRFIPTSGTATFASLLLDNVINQTGGANGITRGLYVNPTLTAAADWRSIEWSNNTGWGLYGAGTSANYLGGKLGIGSTDLSAVGLRVSRASDSSNFYTSIFVDSAIQSSITGNYYSYYSRPNIQNTTFTLTNLQHFSAREGTTFDTSTATVTNQYGYYAFPLIKATNNYGFYGDIASGTGRWNLYMNGTAANYLAGSLGIGTTSTTGLLHARISASAEMYFQNVSQSNLVVSGTNATLILNSTSANFPGVRLQLAGANIGGIEANGTSNIDLVGLNSTTAITFRQVSNERARFAATTGNFLINSTSDSGQRLQVTGDTLMKGSGNTSATTALTVQNSASTNILRVRNDGPVFIEAVSNTASLYFSSNGDSRFEKSITGTNGLILYGPNASHTLTLSSFNSNNYDNGTLSSLRFGGNFVATFGSTAFSYMLLNGTINQTGLNTSITRGLYVNPTLTAAANWRSIEWSNTSGWGLYGAGSANNHLLGNTVIGSTTLLGVKFSVFGDSILRGSGNTSATNALVVQNSDGNLLMSFNNAGSFSFGQNGQRGYISITDALSTLGLQTLTLQSNLTISNTRVSSQSLTNGSLFITRDGIETTTVGTSTTLLYIGHRPSDGFAPTSGTAVFMAQVIAPRINQTGSASGVTRGLYVTPTLTAAADWRSIETSNNSGWAFYGAGTAPSYFAGAISIGNTSTSSAAARVFLTYNATRTWGVRNDGTISSGAVNSIYYTSATRIGASVATTSVTHFDSSEISIGAGATITNQFGFVANSSLTSATNNYGFYGNIASSTNRWNLYMNGSASNFLSGSLGIGSTSLTGTTLFVGKNITGAVTANSILNDATIQTDVTSNAFYFRSTARGANGITLSGISHFYAQQGSLGTGSSVTNQFGYFVDNSLIGATNNYAFYSNIASGTGRWNLYMNGSASNYVNGELLVGTTSSTGGYLIKSVTGIYAVGNLRFDAGVRDNRDNIIISQSLSSVVSNRVLTIGNGTYLNINFPNGNMLIGSTTDNGLKLQVTGSGYFSGSVGIGATTNLTSRNLSIVKNITGSATAYSVVNDSQVQSDVTGNATGFFNGINTANTTFTLNNYMHFDAVQGTIGASSTVNNQYGFRAASSLTGATNNFGFRGDIASGTGRWNLFMNGTAANYLNGDLRVNTTTATNAMIFASTTGKTNVVGMRVGGNATQAVSIGFFSNQTLNSANSSEYFSFNSNTDIGSGTYSITAVTNYLASIAAKPVGVTIGTLYGFRATSALIQGTNNYGFYGDIASGTGRWNLFMNGSAANYFNGNTIMGTLAADSGEKLQVNGTMKVTGATRIQGVATLVAGAILQGIFINQGQAVEFQSAGLAKFYNATNALYASIYYDANGLLFTGAPATFSSSIQAGGGTTNASAVLQADSTTKGFLPPRMTSTQRAAISTPSVGLVVYQTDGTEGLYIYTNASGWKSLAIVN